MKKYKDSFSNDVLPINIQYSSNEFSPYPESEESRQSSDDEEEASMMSKIGSFLFFGCGNSKDNG